MVNPLLSYLPVTILAIEYFIGGIPRLSPFPLRKLNQHIYDKTILTAPHLAPVFPFTDIRSPKTVRWHMRVVGGLMVVTGVLLAVPASRGNLVTLFLSLFLPAAGVWSQAKAGMPYWLPVVNSCLGGLVHWIEKNR